MHGNTILLFNRYAKPYFRPNMRVLEIGPGEPPSVPIFPMNTQTNQQAS
jgi:hypothetical protein